jgi:hypothetical protein
MSAQRISGLSCIPGYSSRGPAAAEEPASRSPPFWYPNADDILAPADDEDGEDDDDEGSLSSLTLRGIGFRGRRCVEEEEEEEEEEEATARRRGRRTALPSGCGGVWWGKKKGEDEAELGL